VLLVEDNHTNQIAAARMLEMLGYQVDVAVNGIEAVQACRDIDYGLVLMDNQMPEMDGVTATRAIREMERARERPPVPIIALTADAMDGDREKCLAAGMNDYLSKPFKVAQLREMIERWGQTAPSDADVPSGTVATSAEAAVDLSVFDVFRDAGASGTADAFVAHLIDQYLAEASTRMASLKDALEHNDGAAVGIATHSLKGMSSTVGAARLAAMCEELGTLAHSATFTGTPDQFAAIEQEFARVRVALLAEQNAVR
jgi:CheY-like chemotaxis protein